MRRAGSHRRCRAGPAGPRWPAAGPPWRRTPMRTQDAIVGAGQAGLLLTHLLAQTGVDGLEGCSDAATPEVSDAVYSRASLVACLVFLAAAAPSGLELIYAHHERGFALHSLRPPALTRLYLQCGPDEAMEAWSDARIWE